jgi:histidinol phosphatase-like PHP family hydrolase
MRDLNMAVVGELRDMALVHASPHGRLAYKRAALAVAALDRMVDEVAAQGSLRDVPFLGPASERVILEHLEHGASSTVARAIEKSGREEEVRSARAYRKSFLSRAGALRVLRTPKKGAIGREDYRGDLQMHSEWSDGGESIVALASAAADRGYRYIAVSDHSYGLKIARGMSMADAHRRRREIDAINAGSDGEVRVLNAIEANIPAEGGVDMTDEELTEFEIVLAAPHSKLRRQEDQTERMIATVRHPGVHILAHPRGRMYSRQGVLARWDEVFEEASKHGVAIEIDGDPYRQDLDFDLAKRALDAGCLFALDSDAHAGDELAYADIALAHARLAGIPPSRVLNTWDVAKLSEWAARRPRVTARRPARTLRSSRGTATRRSARPPRATR